MNVLKHLNIVITDDDADDALNKLASWKYAVIDGEKDVGFSLFNCDNDKAKEVGNYMDEFYDNLPERLKAYEEAYKKEEIIVKVLLLYHHH